MINANGTENGANGINFGVNDDTTEVSDKIEIVPDTMKKCRIVSRNVRF